MSDIRFTQQSPNRNFNPMNSSMQFIPDINFENQSEDQISPKKEIMKKGILKTFYYQDIKRRKLIGCNIYVNQMNEQQLQLSKRGIACRICMSEEETSRFIMPCACKGSLQYVHEECLKLWILQKNGINDVFQDRIKCELCSQKFSMKMQLQNHFDKSRFWDVPKQQKICWLIQLVMISAIICSIVGIASYYQVLLKFVGFSSIGVDAVMTILIVLCLIVIIKFGMGVFQFHLVEMIENWTISNYRARKETRQGSIFQLQSQMGNSGNESPLAKKKNAQVHPNGPNVLQVVQISQLISSPNISEQ
ncbi:unnamed protein product (macronuclear) [Paramecium tetraurelia]|uniref:RING-CH-type domain-containing protein n=1 Tax=Paramecium tetraurelia TaxID=5888 RepID=A0BC79_PARTE|nr:uncharacterized protein GSPATT00004240001 [Paramecium tetraurelia]CAK56146.1 unnamed protein product [Paramecium tetraurelia]|eukprot:XP_001423544.1 hypothetical protein (macronuclear) [Paramecium tetraurelia strain d4-2]